MHVQNLEGETQCGVTTLLKRMSMPLPGKRQYAMLVPTMQDHNEQACIDLSSVTHDVDSVTTRIMGLSETQNWFE